MLAEMPRSGIFHLLSLFFICSVASLSLSPPTTYHQLSNLTNNDLTARADCTGFKLFYVRPLWRDCAAAIEKLSGSRRSGNFHARGEYDEWQLPVGEEVGTCILAVEMTQSALGEPSSWNELKTEARKLNDGCRVKGIIGDSSGGVVKVGEHQWIRISLKRSLMGGEAKDR